MSVGSRPGGRPAATAGSERAGTERAGAAAARRAALGNADFPWDLFDSDSYWQHNYRTVHEFDRAIIERLAGFFAAQQPGGHRWHGVDVGSGTNLYPALAMLPLVETVTLREYSAANVRWLRHALRPQQQIWGPFWDALAESAAIYRRYPPPGKALPAQATVEKASIFDLPAAAWDVGTMFFVAESITGRWEEFEAATLRFVRSLRPGAPFAAAFMRQSHGYTVGDRQFPAVSVTEDDVESLLRPVADAVDVQPISATRRLREGHDGMILVTGVRGREERRGPDRDRSRQADPPRRPGSRES